MESQPDRQVPPGPAKPTPALPGEQVAFKEFETPWTLAGSGRGKAHLAPGAGDRFWGFLHLRGTSQVSNPSGWIISRAGRAPFHWIRSSGIGFLQGQALQGDGDHTPTCRGDLGRGY